jgi:catechol 2,3-dioxygenase
LTETIHPDTAMGCVHLTVSNLDRSIAFYTGTLGMGVLASEGATATLGAGDAELLRLRADASAPRRPPRTSGLFHFAVLVPGRLELARSLARLGARRHPLTGASDHLVSEALYLNDPDGIGIEIYRDRPREEWRTGPEGVAMATLPLDLEGILGELGGREPGEAGLPAGTRIGHVHLNVADLRDAEAFYCDVLGFAATARNYPGALFVAAGGYHHHLGLNIWNGAGAPPPPDGAIGLGHYEIVVPDTAALAAVAGRRPRTGADGEGDGDAVLARDPAGNRLSVRTAG